MKKKVFIFLVVALLLLSLASCNKNGNGGDDKEEFKIVPLADLTDYGTNAGYYNVSKLTYSDTDDQIADLDRAIADENAEYANIKGKDGTQFPDDTQEDFDKRLKDRSTASKIFADATSAGIMDTLAKAALPDAKMRKTVAYLAGPEKTNGAYNKNTANFIDDLDELDRLKDDADSKSGKAKEDADDEVARQERLIMSKVFDIGMTGDEFARVVTEGMIYVQSVLNDKMIPDYNEEKDTDLDRNTYCKEVLEDYDFLVYIMSFNDIYYGQDGKTVVANDGKQKCVRLYGYYYDYNKIAYDNLPEDDFELQLKYSHQDKFSDAEWSDYLRIQKSNYLKSYRYSDAMYKKINNSQMEFKARQEVHDVEVYKVDNNINIGNILKESPYNTTYSKETIKAQEFLVFQMEMTDQLYYYVEQDGADTPEIIEYNRANTVYQDALAAHGDEKEHNDVAIPRLKFEYAQLKIADYLLNKMNNNSLTGVLKFQIYSFSADSCRAITSKRKDIVLLNVGIKEPSEEEIADYTNQEPEEITHATPFNYDTPVGEAIGRAKVIEQSLSKNYGQANPGKQIGYANDAAWAKIRTEVKTTLEQEYNYNATGIKAKEEHEKFEDTLIKKTKKYDGEVLLPRSQWDYDTTHETSRLLDTHKSVFKYAMKKIEVSYHTLEKAKDTTKTAHGFEKSEVAPADFGEPLPAKIVLNSIEYTTFPLSFSKVRDKEYDKNETPTDDDLDPKDSTKYTLAACTVEEEHTGIPKANYKYEFEFEGFYLDKNMKYKFIEGSDLECDIVLYAGYTITKTKIT